MAQVVATEVSNLPDRSVLIVEGGMAGVIDKASDLHFFTVFQENVCDPGDSFAGNKQSQVP